MRLAPAFAEREFRTLFVGQAASAIGDGIVAVALPFAVLQQSGSPTDVGVVLAAAWTPFLLFVVVGGVVADRMPRRKIMITGDIIRLAAQGATAVLLLGGASTVSRLAALQALWGFGSALFGPASTALVPQTVSPANLQGANALMGLSMSGASIVGPIAAGALLVAASPGWAFAADAFSFFVSAAFLARLRPLADAADSGPHDRFLQELRSGWGEFRSHPWLWTTVGLAALWHLIVLAPILVLGPIIARTELGGPRAWALLTLAFGVGAAIGGAAAIHLKPSRPLFVGVFLLLPYSLPPLLLAQAVPAEATAVAVAVAAFGISFFSAVHVTAMQEGVPASVLARVSAYDWLGSVASLPLGLVLVGPVAEATSAKAVLASSAAVWFGVTLLVLSLPSVRTFRRAEGWQERRALQS